MGRSRVVGIATSKIQASTGSVYWYQISADLDLEDNIPTAVCAPGNLL